MTRITIYPSEALKARLQDEAKRQHRTVSNLVLFLVKQALRHDSQHSIHSFKDLTPFVGTLSERTGAALEQDIRASRARVDTEARSNRESIAKRLRSSARKG